MHITALSGCWNVKELCHISDLISPLPHADGVDAGCDDIMREIHCHAMRRVEQWRTGYPFAEHLLFTSTGRYGQVLANFVGQHKLGAVMHTLDDTSPVRCWVWTPDWHAVKVYNQKFDAAQDTPGDDAADGDTTNDCEPVADPP
jgi:hypothetical protein